MTHLIEDFKVIEISLSEEKGEFTLFGLFLREDAPNVWDVVVAAPWIYADKWDALSKISSKINSVLDSREVVSLSRIVIIDERNPALGEIHQEIRVRHGMEELRDVVLFGLQIKQAFIITSQRESEIGERTSLPAR